MAAAIMGRLLATEADQAQNFKDLEKMLDNMTASNSTTINASTNLYKSFFAWTRGCMGKMMSQWENCSLEQVNTEKGQ